MAVFALLLWLLLPLQLQISNADGADRCIHDVDRRSRSKEDNKC